MSSPDSAQLLTSTSNPHVKRAAKLHGRKGRKEQQRFIIEGPRALSEGIHAVSELFATQQAVETNRTLVETILDQGAAFRLVTEEVMAVLTDTVGPPGIIGVADIPSPRLEDVLAAKPSLLVVLDKVRDPGNAGTIIRSADAAGADGVVFLHHSTDPYNPKSIRSTAGSIFHLPVLTGLDSAAVQQIRDAGIQCLAAEVHQGTALYQQNLLQPTALIFGGEAEGLSATTKALCDQSVHIPMPKPSRPGYSGQAESLNLAAAVAIMTFAVSYGQQGGFKPSAVLEG